MSTFSCEDCGLLIFHRWSLYQFTPCLLLTEMSLHLKEMFTLTNTGVIYLDFLSSIFLFVRRE